MGFSTELLSSKIHNLRVINKLTEEQIEELKGIIFGHIFQTKFRSDEELEAKVGNGDREAMAKALTKHRVKPTLEMCSTVQPMPAHNSSDSIW